MASPTTVEQGSPKAGIADRLAGKVRLFSTLLIVAALLVLVRALPVEQGVGALHQWISGLGFWGPAAFALVYVVATVLFIPGLILTLASGAIFGLFVGFLTVSVGSTLGAGLAFLIARYLARSRVEGMARESPRFAAIDAAIGEGGWKIVALLRLSPALPFNLQNYLFGLTPIRFWAYFLTSWIAMMPGTFLYVYIGHLTGAAVGGGHSRTPAEWALLGAGLAATVGVTVYVTLLARRQLALREPGVANRSTTAATAEPPSAPPRNWTWGTTAILVLALLLGSVAAFSWSHPGRLQAALRLGPEAVHLQETYAAAPAGPHFDHQILDRLLHAHVVAGGWVDYHGLAQDAPLLDSYLAAVAKAPFARLGRNEKLALLLNAYNAATLRLILDHYPLASIKDIPASQRWQARRWVIGGRTLSLDEIEHQEIRPHFAEPRVHFALVCAAVGCPPLRNEAYAANRLDEQLADQTRYLHEHATWVRWDPERRTLWLTPLYKWYGSDFTQVAGSVPAFVARYIPGLAAVAHPEIRWLDYDWRLNDVSNRQPR